MRKRFHLKNISFFVAIILIMGVLSGCSNQSTENNKSDSDSSVKATSSKITPEEAKKRLDSETGIILLDVRTVEEYEGGHIKDSKLMPVDNLSEEAPRNLEDKAAPIFVYCRSGNRSASAVKILVDLGYTNVYDLGGIQDWPYEVVK